MYTISKQFHFSASHQLLGLAEDHPCSRLHGHNYIVEAVLAADTLDERGFVVDYGELKPFQRLIDTLMDHRHLNDVVTFQTSAENLARFLFQECQAMGVPVVAMRVSETPKTWAEYRP